MRRHRPIFLLLVAVGLTTCSGASCPRMVRQTLDRPVLPPEPTLEQVIEVVNRNNSQIHSFSTTNAELSSPDMPVALRGTGIAFERPKRLRVRAGTLVTGPELDLGSNDELFWIWLRRSPRQTLYFCRHDRFATSPIRRMIPIDPDWLIEALGIAEFDPALPHQGPFVQKGGGLEIRTIRETADGPTTKVTVVHPVKGQILGQYLFDPRGQLVASSIIHEHRYDPVTGLTIPRKIEIRCPPTQFTLRIDLGTVRINRLAGDPQDLWRMPRGENYPLVDLGDPNFQVAPPVERTGALPGLAPSANRQPGAAYRRRQ